MTKELRENEERIENDERIKRIEEFTLKTIKELDD